MKEIVFTGSAVALVTPFAGENVDFVKLEELVEYHINNGTDAILMCGSTGEGSTLSDEEHLNCIKCAIKKSNKRIPVIASVGSNDTKHAIYLSKAAEKLGADALLSVVPYYNKPTQDGLFEHFKAIAQSVNIPIILYNVPSRTITSLSPETVKRLSDIPNIVGIKECVTANVSKHIRNCPEDFSVYTGEDTEVLSTMSMGAKGVISVIANVMPKQMKKLTESAINGDYEEARKIQLSLAEINEYMFIEPSPVPIKAAMNALGMNVGDCRLPLLKMTEVNKEKMCNALNKVIEYYNK